MRAQKKLLIFALAFICVVAATMSAVTFNVAKASEPSLSAEYQWTVERSGGAKVTGGNYAVYSVQTDFATAPMLTGTEEYWGVGIKNFSGNPTRVRFGFEMGGGVVLWIGKADTKLYFVSKDGKVTEWTMTSAQYADVPAYFSGTLYLKKTDAYGWTTDAASNLVKNKYRAKGVRIGFDFRNEYKAKIGIDGISVANIVSDGATGFVTENAELKLTFDNATAGKPIYLGTVSEEAKTAIAADFTCVKEAAYEPVNPADPVPVTEGNTAIVYERTDKTALSGSNYRQLSVTTDYAKAPTFKAEGYFGLKIKNLLASETRVRYGLEMGGGVQCYMPGAGKVAYLLWADGTVTEFNITNAQFVNVPANFDGTIYLNKAELYNWTNEKVVTNKYKVKGVVFGYDLRLDYQAKLAVTGITEADVVKTDNETIVNNVELKMNFDDATATASYLGNPAAEMKAQMDEKVTDRRIPLSIFEEEPTELSISKLPRTDYVLGDTADYSTGKAVLTYKSGETTETVEYPLTDERFEISGFSSVEPDENCTVTVKCGQLSTTFGVKIISNIVSGDEEEGDYLYLEKKGEINKYKTGWIYVQMAMLEWMEEGKNATGRGNCLGLRVENVNTGVAKIRLEIRSHNANDPEDTATHRTGQWNNANAYVWFLEDGATEITSLQFNKTTQYVTVPAGAKGTIYFAYDKDFSWKGHTAEYGMSHLAIGFDMRSANSAKLIVKEVFDSYYTVKEGAKYIGIDDKLENGAAVDTHFTTDVKIVDFRRFLSTKQLDLTDKVSVSEVENSMPDCRHSVMLLCSTNYAAWTTVTEALVEEELAKISLGVYNPDDYAVSGIAVKTLPKTEYKIGDLSDWENGVVTVTYRSGRTEDVAMTSSLFVLNGFTSLEPNENLTVTVSLADNVEIKTTFTVKVAASQTGGGEDKPAESGCSGCSSAINGGALTVFALVVLAAAVSMKKKRA